ncbi:hypothetical protein Q0N51_13660 [Priestia megaterium]
MKRKRIHFKRKVNKFFFRLIKHQKKNKNRRQKTVGVVMSDSLLSLNANTSLIPLPLTIPRYVTGKIKISVGGGLKLVENGKYLITLNANVLSESTGTIAVYAGTEFLGTTNSLTAGESANFSLIKRLKKGVTIQAILTGINTVNPIRQSILSVIKVGN